MNQWIDIVVVSLAVVASIAYAIYALGPKRIKDAYSRLATKYFGLRAARWFRGTGHDCNSCEANPEHKRQ